MVQRDKVSKITKLTKELGHRTGNPFFLDQQFVFFFFYNLKLGLLLNEFKAALRITEHSESLERPWCSLMNVLGFWEVMGETKAGGILHGAG